MTKQSSNETDFESIDSLDFEFDIGGKLGGLGFTFAYDRKTNEYKIGGSIFAEVVIAGKVEFSRNFITHKKTSVTLESKFKVKIKNFNINEEIEIPYKASLSFEDDYQNFIRRTKANVEVDIPFVDEDIEYQFMNYERHPLVEVKQKQAEKKQQQYDLNALSAAHDAVRDPRDNPFNSRNPSSALSQDSQYGEEGGFGYRDYDRAHNSDNGFEGGNNGGGASNKENFCDGWANDNTLVEMDIIKQVSSNRLIYVNYVSYDFFLKH